MGLRAAEDNRKWKKRGAGLEEMSETEKDCERLMEILLGEKLKAT